MNETSLQLLICDQCHGTGEISDAICSNCRGKSVGQHTHGKFLFWDFPLDPYHIAFRSKKKSFNKIIHTLILFFGCLGIGGGLYLFFQTNFTSFSLAFVAIGFMLILFFISRVIRLAPALTEVIVHNFNSDESENTTQKISWQEISKLHSVDQQNISTAFTDEALFVIEDSYVRATRAQAPHVTAVHLFRALIDNFNVQTLLVRLLLSPANIQKATDSLMVSGKISSAPLVSEQFWKIIFSAYEEAWNHREPKIGIVDLLITAVFCEDRLRDMLFDFGVTEESLQNMAEWIRVREQLKRGHSRRIHGAQGRSKKGDTNRAMTAVATPFLNSCSLDLTKQSLFGNLEPMVGRTREIETIFRVLQGGGMSVLLVGNPGVGKTTLISGIADLMVSENVPEILKDKRLVELDVPRLLAGADASEAEDRLLRMLQELENAGNIILVIPSLEKLIGITVGTTQGMDVAGVLTHELSKGNFLTIATTTPEAFNRSISNGQLAQVFQKIEIDEMDVNATIQVLEAKAGYIEYKQQIWFSYGALERAASMSARYLHDTYLPSKAIEICNEVALYVRNKKGKDQLVTADDVAAIIAEKTKIPVTAVTENETDKLMRLESEMHKRVVGQEEAVTLVANALRRARAEIRSGKRPIANFLFLGPTGVGKTELTKTIAEVYFGNETQMVRMDMSEYQDTNSIYRLIGRPGEQGTGVLTEAVRQKPFALILLDEIEKADPNILNLFLQVMDDGRLTDSVGRVIDFTNVILIATSNAGTQFVQEQMQLGETSEHIKNKLIHGELKQNFRPEFLNRFDAIVLFKPLTQEQIVVVARNILRAMGKKLEERGIFLEVTDLGAEALAQAGFDPEFGARPLRRVIQDKVENVIAGMLLQNQVVRKDTIVIDADSIVIRKAS